MARKLPAPEEVEISIIVLPDRSVRTLSPVIMIRRPVNFFLFWCLAVLQITGRFRICHQGNHAPPDLCLRSDDFRLVMRQNLPGAKEEPTGPPFVARYRLEGVDLVDDNGRGHL